MNRKTVMIVAVTALVVLLVANRLRSLPLVNKIPEV